MARTSERKDRIKKYLIEKIYLKEENIVARAIEAFEVSKTAIYSCINELVAEGTVSRSGRGCFLLCDACKMERIEVNTLKEFDEDIICKRIMSDIIEKMPDNCKRIWMYSFSGMLNNVIEHSKADSVEIQVRSNICGTTVVIYDNGVGLYENIRKCFGFADYDEVEEELFKGKLTTDSSNHSGEGIFFTSRIMDKFAAVSNGRVYSIDNRWIVADDQREIEFWKEKPGTTIFMHLKNDGEKSLKVLFDSFSDDEGCFDKTNIPMRKLFDGYPVARSQAKRLCRRFENFKVVILNFDGVDEIGQGFADQIFRIFRNEHPDIEIRMENANKVIQKMYNHVVSG